MTSKYDVNLRTPDIIKFESLLANLKAGLANKKENLEKVIEIFRQTVIEFTNITKIFISLSKYSSELDDQLFSKWKNQDKDSQFCFSFDDLKNAFRISGEGFEVLVFKFNEYFRNAENVSADVSEVISCIDEFMRNKAETVNKIWAMHVGLSDK